MNSYLQHLPGPERIAVPSNWIGSALVLALILVALVCGLFYYLNRLVKRKYFSQWMIAWVFFGVYVVAAIGLQDIPGNPLLLLIRRACIGLSGLFMFWGSFELTYQPRTARELY